MIKILGKETVINQVGEEHRYCGGLIYFFAVSILERFEIIHMAMQSLTLFNHFWCFCRKLRRIFTSNFFNPEGISLYVPRMDAITRDHIAKHWEGKDSILGVPVVREFTYSVAADIFMSLRETDPRFRSLYQTMEDVISGVLQVPINLPGTVYHKGWIGRGKMNEILDTLITERKQVRWDHSFLVET